MRILPLSLSALTVLLMVPYPTLAQESKPVERVIPAPMPPGSGPGYEQFLRLMRQNINKPEPASSRSHEVYPMFQLNGPDLNADFWKDPETAGRMLVLQGELMKRMGETLIEQGEALLKQAAPAAPETN